MKKRKITDNIPLKIMSVAVAVVLWLIVVNIDNPIGTNYYTINDVELINKEYVESSDTIGKMCMPEQNQDSIKIATGICGQCQQRRHKTRQGLRSGKLDS